MLPSAARAIASMFVTTQSVICTYGATASEIAPSATTQLYRCTGLLSLAVKDPIIIELRTGVDAVKYALKGLLHSGRNVQLDKILGLETPLFTAPITQPCIYTIFPAPPSAAVQSKIRHLTAVAPYSAPPLHPMQSGMTHSCSIHESTFLPHIPPERVSSLSGESPRKRP